MFALVLELVMDRATLADTRLQLRETQRTLAHIPRTGVFTDRARIRIARRALRRWHNNLRKRVHTHSWMRRRVRHEDTPILVNPFYEPSR